VLFVVGNTSLSTADAAIRSRLQLLGALVTTKAATSTTTSDASGRALIVISDSVTSADVGGKFTSVAVPVLSGENAVLDDMGLTGSVAGADFGTTANQTEVGLAAVSQPIAQGLTVAITSSAQTYAWGKPAVSAMIIATIAGDVTHASIFAYDSGATMVHGRAPARRAAWLAAGNTAANLTSNGWKLFDNTVRWLTSDCPVGTHTCGATCVSDSSVTSCGTSCAACAAPANASPICSGGVCSIVCNQGFKLCGGGCISDASSCGGACPAGMHACGATCVSDSSVTSCGTSCAACAAPANASPICSGGVCSIVCNQGFKLCGGACISNASSCGGG
jgi:hypothetical protein